MRTPQGVRLSPFLGRQTVAPVVRTAAIYNVTMEDISSIDEQQGTTNPGDSISSEAPQSTTEASTTSDPTPEAGSNTSDSSASDAGAAAGAASAAASTAAAAKAERENDPWEPFRKKMRSKENVNA